MFNRLKYQSNYLSGSPIPNFSDFIGPDLEAKIGDASNNFLQFMGAFQENQQIAKESPVLVLSPLSAATIISIAQRAYNSQKELTFSLQGIKMLTKDHTIFTSAYASPAMNFANLEKK